MTSCVEVEEAIVAGDAEIGGAWRPPVLWTVRLRVDAKVRPNRAEMSPLNNAAAARHLPAVARGFWPPPGFRDFHDSRQNLRQSPISTTRAAVDYGANAHGFYLRSGGHPLFRCEARCPLRYFPCLPPFLRDCLSLSSVRKNRFRRSGMITRRSVLPGLLAVPFSARQATGLPHPECESLEGMTRL
jgi:hypothetical protein